MAMSQAQYLLMLAEDARAQGDELSEEMSRKGRAHAQQVLELSVLIDRAKEIIDREKNRFGQYLPQTTRPPNELGQSVQPRIMRKVGNESQT